MKYQTITISFLEGVLSSGNKEAFFGNKIRLITKLEESTMEITKILKLTCASVLTANHAFALSGSNPQTTTITEQLVNLRVINNVNVYSSAMQAWVCGAGLLNNDDEVGSDNRVYGTATTFKKGTTSLANSTNVNGFSISENPMNVAAEANASDTNYSTPVILNGDVKHLDYFNSDYHTELSDVRGEFSSLAYGAGMYIDVCVDLPFSYETDIDLQYSKLSITTNHQISQIDQAAASDLSDDYLYGAAPILSTRIVCSIDEGEGSIDVGNGLSDLDTSLNGIGVDYQFATPDMSINSNAVFLTETFNISDSGTKKCVVRFIFKETTTNQETRIKGAAEALRWNQSVTVDLDFD